MADKHPWGSDWKTIQLPAPFDSAYRVMINGTPWVVVPDSEGKASVPVPVYDILKEMIDAKGRYPVAGSGTDSTQTITKTGVVIDMNAEEGDDITIDASGATSVTLIHAGKNLLQIPASGNGSYMMTDVAWKRKDNGKITIKGTTNTTSGNNGYLNMVTRTDGMYLAPGKYTLSGTVPAKTGWIFGVQKPGGATFGRINGDTPSVTFELAEPTQILAYYLHQVTEAAVEEIDATCWVQLERGETATDFVPGSCTVQDAYIPTTVTAHEGSNILYTTGGDVLTASITRKVTSGVDEDAVNNLIQQAIAFDPSVYDIPVLTLDGDISEMSKETKVELEYTFRDKDGNPIEGTAKVKWQGASSVATGTAMGGLYNLTVKLDNKVELAKGWGKHKTYCFKANAIDHSHARNICSAKLWGEIVKSRTTVPPEFADLPNGGAIDGFPVACMINGEFYALGTLNTPKDEYIFTSDTYAPKAFVSANDHTDATQFKGLATFEGDFDFEYIEEPVEGAEATVTEDTVKASINTMIQAVMDSDGTDLDTVVGQYIDIDSAIDYMIFAVYEKAGDGTDKNYLLVTYDNVKWYFSAYDMDTVLGLQWDGSTFLSPGSGLMFANYAAKHKLMELLWANKKSEIIARATKLRKNALSEVNVGNVLTIFGGQIPSALLEANTRRWPLLRNTNSNNTWQMLNWYRLRCIAVDAELGI